MNWRLIRVSLGLCLVAVMIALGFALKPVLEPPGHKTRQDHMDQLDRIESKLDELIEIGRKWE